jgi:WD40 repeat protein
MARAVLIRGWWTLPTLLASLSLGCAGEKPVPAKNDVTPVHSLAFSPDGKRLAAGRGTYAYEQVGVGTGEVVVWPTDNWDAPKVYKNDLTHRVAGLAFSANGRTLIAASDNYIRDAVGDPFGGNRIDTWDVETGKPAKMIKIEWEQGEQAGRIHQMAVEPKSGLIALARGSGWPYAFDLKTGEQKYKIKDLQSETVALSADGKTLATTTVTAKIVKQGNPPNTPHVYSHEVQLREAQTGKLIARLDISEEDSSALAYSSDGRLAVGSKSGNLLIISADVKKIEATLQLKAEMKGKYVTAVAFTPDGTQLAAAAVNLVSVIDPKKCSVRRTLDHPARVNAIAYSPDNKLLAVGYGDEKNDGTIGPCGVKVSDAATGDLIKDLK